MKKTFFATLFVITALVVLPGCGSDGATDVTDGASEEALQDYDAMIQAEEDAMNADMEGNL